MKWCAILEGYGNSLVNNFMKIQKSLFGFFLLALVVFFIGSGWHFLGSGFRLQKIAFVIPVNPKWETPISYEEKTQLEEIVKQPFFYLDKGRQSYVFSSRDGKYVLKLFRYHLVRKRFSLYISRYVCFWDKAKKKKLKSKQKQFEDWMESYHLAFTKLQKETGLIYMHLVKTNDLPSVVIQDKLGRSFSLDLNKYGFLLQKKTDLLFPVVQKLVKKKQDQKLQKVIQAYIKTVADRHQKGIQNKDHLWTKNYGIVGFSEVVEIDVGRYSFIPSAKTEKELRQELYLYTGLFHDFLAKNYPKALQDYEEAIEKEVNKRFL